MAKLLWEWKPWLAVALVVRGLLIDEFYPEEGVPTGSVLAVTCFGLKINELPSCIAKDIFKALFVDYLVICFRGRSLDTIGRHLQQAVNAIQEWATRNGFRFAAQKCKVIHFTAPRSRAERPPIVRIGNTSASGGVHEIDSLNTLFETIPETFIVEFLREVGFFYLIWRN